MLIRGSDLMYEAELATTSANACPAMGHGRLYLQDYPVHT